MSAALHISRAKFDVVALVASAGGFGALRDILWALPAEFPAAVIILQHRADSGMDDRVRLLAPRCHLSVALALEGHIPAPGTVTLAPSGRQLEVLASGCVSIERCDRVNFCCPSADILLSSVASYYGERALACVLSGNGRDGAEGVKAIRKAGGFVIAQSPGSAEFPGMPLSAIETRKVDLIQPLHRLAHAITTVVYGYDAGIEGAGRSAGKTSRPPRRPPSGRGAPPGASSAL